MGCGSRNWEQLLFGRVCISLRKVMLRYILAFILESCRMTSRVLEKNGSGSNRHRIWRSVCE